MCARPYQVDAPGSARVGLITALDDDESWEERAWADEDDEDEWDDGDDEEWDDDDVDVDDDGEEEDDDDDEDWDDWD